MLELVLEFWIVGGIHLCCILNVLSYYTRQLGCAGVDLTKRPLESLKVNLEQPQALALTIFRVVQYLTGAFEYGATFRARVV